MKQSKQKLHGRQGVRGWGHLGNSRNPSMAGLWSSCRESNANTGSCVGGRNARERSLYLVGSGNSLPFVTGRKTCLWLFFRKTVVAYCGGWIEELDLRAVCRRSGEW